MLDLQALDHLTSPLGGNLGIIFGLSSILNFINSKPCKILLLMLNYNVSTSIESKRSILDYVYYHESKSST